MPPAQHRLEPRGTTGILVAGMHRSGTSVLSRTLSILGCALPMTIMPGGHGNESGHWESKPVAMLNDEILAAAGSSWSDWRPLDLSGLGVDAVAVYRARAIRVLEQEFRTHDPFVLKDPRVCRMLDFWIDVLRRFGARPAIVVPIRNPKDVAASLLERDGLCVEQGHLIWLRHVLDAEALSRGVDRIFLRYDDLVEDWSAATDRIVGALDLPVGRLSEADAATAAGFVSPRLRHHYTRDGESMKAELGEWIAEAFGILVRWSRDEARDGDRQTLDEIRAAFDAAAPAFWGLVSDLERRLGRLERECAEGRRRIDTLECESRERERRIEDMTNSVSWRITEPLRSIGRRRAWMRSP